MRKARFDLIAFSSQYGLVYVTFIYENTDIRLITARKAEKWMMTEYEQYKK
ncbi:MAG: BrnT family toxin [Pyrinomonadaceae bacterium]|nr:BrnT family toxin [Pyrinomonadaceae bacterium]